MQLLSGFAHVSPLQLLLVAAVAFGASVIGGVTGYGTGALMPLVLVPIIGAEPVVPIIAISSLFTNTTRSIAFLRLVDPRRVLIVLVGAIPTCVLGAYGYTRLNDRGAMIVIGGMMIASIPLRRFLKRRKISLTDRGLATGGLGYGLVVGGTAGAGIVLLSLLMAAGLEGAAVIATDAVISIAIGIVKISVFGTMGIVGAQIVAFALLIGLMVLPGAFLAKAIVDRLPVHVHTAVLDAVVIGGGMFLLIGAMG
ncbi:MAG TPA: sulfite exporter TauE/SafE family protein [Xanthobacteraceae bacterium]|jgi:uncharacterized membrane protein YfcA|nr:sulfite exporter TauE/SafE family protein [Xanthobacteraceae bacterium]